MDEPIVPKHKPVHFITYWLQQKLVVILFALTLFEPAFAQSDSAIFAALYEARTAENAGDLLFNGREHTNYHPAIRGVPYYGTANWQKGTLVYGDIPYKDLFLKYDLVADELIVRHPNGFLPVTLFQKRIRSFTLNDKRFVYLQSVDENKFKSGIYEELVNGKTALYSKRSRFIEESIAANSMVRTFVDNPEYYVHKEGAYYLIRKEKDIWDLLQDKKDELKSHLKTAGVKFKRDPDTFMAKIVAYYNQLSQ